MKFSDPVDFRVGVNLTLDMCVSDVFLSDWEIGGTQLKSALVF